MICRNCSESLVQQAIFCTKCGEKVAFKRLTIKSLIATAFDQVLDIDNKLFLTFKKLFKQPEAVINDYIKGFRKKYVNVISYLGLAITLMGLQFFILRKFYPELLSINSDSIKASAFDMQKFFDAFYDYQGLFTIALLPIYALVSRFAFIDSKKYNLAEHFVINTYATAHAFIIWFFVVIITIPLGFNYNLMSQFLSLPLLIYMIFVFNRLYDFSLVSIIFRTIAYTLLAFFVMMIIMIGVGLMYGIYLGATGQIELPETHIL